LVEGRKVRPKEVTDYFSKWFARGFGSTELLDKDEVGPHVQNIVTALLKLGYRIPQTDTFNQTLSDELRRFQQDNSHRNTDGKFGPNTRSLLVEKALDVLGPSFFAGMPPAFPSFYRVFISYAWNDKQKVNKLDQWLRNHGVLVTRDTHDFKAGHKLPDEIRRYLHLCDKACIVYSKTSRSRDWPEFERIVAKEVESLRGLPYLIYLLIDDVKLPQYDPNRIYIDATTRPLRDVGPELLYAVTGRAKEPATFDYDENDPL
jgi:hypothetical protein